MNRGQLYTVPNLITGVRFVLAALLAFLLALEQTTGIAFTACLVFTVAAVSDFVDGYYARKYEVVTVVGKLMDPLADKVLVATALIMLIPLGELPAWIALVILCREMLVTGLRSMASASGVVVAASGLGKYKSVMQYIGLGVMIFPANLLPIPKLHTLGLLIMYVALGLTVWSGLDYFYKLRNIVLDAPAD
ncbi:MAG: CDP-diacylglycerol--glycerol-3-phosphate 3-phosphatidyltransferase [Desulfobulbus propionicus]|nr:MAG: CDP-diacylglycerol--glycerol-3-phosphate 3-phosphatidyltransferase [Desulfobulbus propionicus]